MRRCCGTRICGSFLRLANNPNPRKVRRYCSLQRHDRPNSLQSGGGWAISHMIPKRPWTIQRFVRRWPWVMVTIGIAFTLAWLFFLGYGAIALVYALMDMAF